MKNFTLYSCGFPKSSGKHGLVKYLNEHSKLKNLLVPNKQKYSALLKKSAAKKIVFVNDVKYKLEYKIKKRRTL